jgi:hypothetical protein
MVVDTEFSVALGRDSIPTCAITSKGNRMRLKGERLALGNPKSVEAVKEGEVSR